MRLWHQSLIHHLPDKQLLGQHRECCALRGKGWGKKHSVVDYVFRYDLDHLYEYHCLVMREMILRNFHLNVMWYHRTWRGSKLKHVSLAEVGTYVRNMPDTTDDVIYIEHDDKYLRECLLNLQNKGVELINDASIEEMLLKLEVKLLGEEKS